MGIQMAGVEMLASHGLLGADRAVLDLGSSNLYGATAGEIVEFVKRHNPKPSLGLDRLAERLAIGSGPDATGQAANTAFVGELFEAAGMTYDSIDIAVGYRTTIVDLNTMRLPAHMVGVYDSVLNFGTSEHILNQMNVFGALHAAVKVGGLIMHQVPSTGYVDHGYFCYTSRFFFDLAGWNHYEVVDMWYDVGGTENVFASARQYQTYFPALTKRLEKIGVDPRETAIDKIEIPTTAINIIYRKTKETPFMGTVETSTSVGHLPTDVMQSYQS